MWLLELNTTFAYSVSQAANSPRRVAASHGCSPCSSGNSPWISTALIWTSRPGRFIIKNNCRSLCGAIRIHYPALKTCGNIRYRRSSYNARQAGRPEVLEGKLPVAIRTLRRDKDPRASFSIQPERGVEVYLRQGQGLAEPFRVAQKDRFRQLGVLFDRRLRRPV